MMTDPMRAVLLREPGDESVMYLGEAPDPTPGPGEIAIAVRTAAINRADLLQRQGMYAPPPGTSEILGLECAGVVTELGPGVDGVRVGQRVMALLPGGGYAERVVVHAGSVLPVPDDMSDDEAGAFPEVFLTAYSNLFMAGLGAIAAGESALVHGGGGGVGTAAIMLLHDAGHRVYVTVGSDDKARRCEALGAAAAINYRTGDFAESVRTLTGGRGVDVILDHIGAKYLAQNLGSLAVGGRLVEIGLMGGATAEVPLALLLTRRLSIIGSTLRSRSVEQKTAIVRGFRDRFGHSLAAGRLRPIVDRALPVAQVADAHRAMKASDHFGKIVLRFAS